MHFLAIVVENPGVAEFHGRLNDQPDHVLPSGEQAMRSERGANGRTAPVRSPAAYPLPLNGEERQMAWS
jgi:hypothetical protein